MLAGCLLMASAVIGLALYLQIHEGQQWPTKQTTEIERKYRRSRFRWRSLIHNLLILSGGLMAVAGIAGTQRMRWWLICWILVAMTLLVVVMLAFLDAIRTRRYLRDRLPEMRDEMLD